MLKSINGNGNSKKNKRSMLSLIALLLVLMLSLSGCGGGKDQDPNQDPDAKSETENEVYKIGAIFDITGSASSLGIPERDSALMLEEQINAQGGINGHQIKIIIEDNESNETKAVQAAKKLIEVDQVLAIVGPSTTGTSMAIIDTVQKSQVPLISAAAGISIVTPVEERQWVFKTAQSDAIVVARIMDYLSSIGAKNIAFLSMNNSYGDSGRKEFEKAVPEAGITLVVEEKFGATDTDMTAQLTKVKAAEPDAVVVWAIPPSASIMTKNFRQLGIEAPLIHSHGIGNQTFIDLAMEASEGVLFPTGKLLVAESLADQDPQKTVLLEYASSYEAKFNQPRSGFGGYAFDGISLVAAAIEKAGSDRERSEMS